MEGGWAGEEGPVGIQDVGYQEFFISCVSMLPKVNHFKSIRIVLILEMARLTIIYLFCFKIGRSARGLPDQVRLPDLSPGLRQPEHPRQEGPRRFAGQDQQQLRL